jgi:hypothetical protein
VEQVQYRFIPFFGFYQIVHFLLLSVHRGSILVKVTSQNNEIFVSIVVRVLESFLLNEAFKFFYLLVAGDEGFHIKWDTLSIVTGLEM